MKTECCAGLEIAAADISQVCHISAEAEVQREEDWIFLIDKDLRQRAWYVSCENFWSFRYGNNVCQKNSERSQKSAKKGENVKSVTNHENRKIFGKFKKKLQTLRLPTASERLSNPAVEHPYPVSRTAAGLLRTARGGYRERYIAIQQRDGSGI